MNSTSKFDTTSEIEDENPINSIINHQVLNLNRGINRHNSHIKQRSKDKEPAFLTTPEKFLKYKNNKIGE